MGRKWLRQTKTAARGPRSAMPRQRLHDITVTFVHETLRAVCYNDGTKDFWIPKSALASDGYIQAEENPDGSVTLTAPESWFIERGLV
jgi:hypothetical protein